MLKFPRFIKLGFLLLLLFVAKPCLTLCSHMDCSPPGSSVRGISQARILDWVAMSSCRGSSWPRNWTCVSCTAGRFFATELPGKPWLSIGFLKQTKGTYLYLNSQKINFKFNASFLEQTMKAKSEIDIIGVQSLRCVQSGLWTAGWYLGHFLSTYHQAPQAQVPSQCGLPPSGCDFVDDFWWTGKKQTSWSSHLLLGCGDGKTKERIERKRRRGEGRKEINSKQFRA